MIECFIKSFAMKLITYVTAITGLYSTTAVSGPILGKSIEPKGLVARAVQHLGYFIGFTRDGPPGRLIDNYDLDLNNRNVTMRADLYNETIFQIMGLQEHDDRGKL